MTLYEFLEKNSIYLVLIIALTIWFALFGYLFKLDIKLRKLEKSVHLIENKEKVER